MLKLDINGTTFEVEGIDINVFGPPYTEDDHVHIAVYEMRMGKDGFWDTQTGETLVTMETNLDPEEWEDDWFGYSPDSGPTDVPGDVMRFVRPFLVEA